MVPLMLHSYNVMSSPLSKQPKCVCVYMAGAVSEAVPGSEPTLPAPAAPLPTERRPESKPAKPSKPAAKAAKPVELPSAEFQTQEPFVPPPTKSKV